MPAPEPGEHEVVLDVRAAALNHLDIWVREGRPGLEVDKPRIIGTDAAGTISAVGPRVHGREVGDDVVLYPGLNCGCCEFCIQGQHSQCTRFGIVGVQRHGTFAEKVAVPASNVWPIPDNLDMLDAAAFPVAYLTAWRMLFTRAELVPGDTVLIHGIGGGVALAGLQLAGMSGAQAIVTSSSDEKLERARDLGAAHTINYRTSDDVADEVHELTGGRGVDIALDSVGAATWPIDLSAVRKGGTVVNCGVTTGAEAKTNLHQLYWNQLSALGSTLGSLAEFRKFLRAVEVNGLEPVVDTSYSLDDVREAMSRIEEGNQMGKILLTPGT
jgi:NADPH:quinone reductase-like Zn-dependent oxidoreductase